MPTKFTDSGSGVTIEIEAIDETDAAFSDAQNNIELFAKHVEQFNRTLGKLGDPLKNSLDGIEKSFTAIGASIIQAGSKLDQLGNEISNVETKFGTIGRTITSSADQLNSFADNITNLNKEIGEGIRPALEKFDQLKESLEDLQTPIKNVDKVFNEGSKEIEKDLGKLQTTINKTSDTFENAFKDSDTLFDNIKQSITSLGEKLKNIPDLDQHFQDLNNLPQVFQEVEQSLTGLAQKIQSFPDLSKNFQNIGSSSNNIASSFKEIEQSLTELSSKIKDFPDFAKLFQNIGGSASNISTNFEKIEKSLGELSSKIKDFPNFKDLFQNINSSYSNISNTFSKIEKSLTELSQKIREFPDFSEIFQDTKGIEAFQQLGEVFGKVSKELNQFTQSLPNIAKNFGILSNSFKVTEGTATKFSQSLPAAAKQLETFSKHFSVSKKDLTLFTESLPKAAQALAVLANRLDALETILDKLESTLPQLETALDQTKSSVSNLDNEADELSTGFDPSIQTIRTLAKELNIGEDEIKELAQAIPGATNNLTELASGFGTVQQMLDRFATYLPNAADQMAAFSEEARKSLTRINVRRGGDIEQQSPFERFRKKIIESYQSLQELSKRLGNEQKGIIGKLSDFENAFTTAADAAPAFANKLDIIASNDGALQNLINLFRETEIAISQFNENFGENLKGIRNFTEAIGNIKEETTEWLSAVREKRNNLKDLGTEVGKVSRATGSFESSLESTTDRFNKINEHLDKSVKEFNNFSEFVNKSQDTLNSFQTEFNNLTPVFNTWTSTVNQNRESLEKLNNSYTKIEKGVEDWKEALQSSVSDLTQTAEKVKQIDTNVDAFGNSLQGGSDNLDQLGDHFQKIISVIQTWENSLAGSEDNLKKIRTNLSNTATSLGAMSKRLAENNTRFEKFGPKVTAAGGALSTVSTTLRNEIIPKFPELKTALNEATQAFSGLQAGTDEYLSGLSELRSKTEETKTALNNWNTALGASGQHLSHLDQAIGQIIPEFGNWLNTITESQTKLRDFDSDLGKISSETTEWANKLTESHLALSHVEAGLKDAQNRLTGFSRAILRNSDTFESIGAKLNAVLTYTKRWNQSLKTQISVLTGLDTEITNLKQGISDWVDSLNLATAQLLEFSASFSETIEEAKELKNSIASIKDTVDDFKKDIGAAQHATRLLTTGFNQADVKVRKLGEQFTVTKKQAKGTGEAFDVVTDQILETGESFSSIKETIEVTGDALLDAAEEVEKTRIGFNRSNKALDEYTEKIKSAKAGLTGFNPQATRATKGLEQLANWVSAGSDRLKKFNPAITQAKTAINNWAEAVNNSIPNMQELGKQFKQIDKSITNWVEVLDKSATLFGEVEDALKKLKTGITQFTERVGAGRKSLSQWETTLRGSKRAVEAMTGKVTGLDVDLDELGKTTDETSKKTKRFSNNLEQQRGALLAAMFVLREFAEHLLRIVRALVDAAIKFESFVDSLKVMEGSAAKAAGKLEELRQIARLPGVELEPAVKATTTLRALGVEGELARNVIIEFGNALALAGSTDFSGALLGLTQIISKGKVHAEELNQLRERSAIFAKALEIAFGTTNSEKITDMFEEGRESMIRFTRVFIKGLQTIGRAGQDTALNTLLNLNNALFDLKVTLGQQILPHFIKTVKALTSLLETAKDLSGPLKNVTVIMLGITTATLSLSLALGGLGLALSGLLPFIGLFGIKIIAATAIISAIVGGLVLLNNHIEQSKKQFKELAEERDNALNFEGFVSNKAKTILQQEAKELEKTLSDLRKQLSIEEGFDLTQVLHHPVLLSLPSRQEVEKQVSERVALWRRSAAYEGLPETEIEKSQGKGVLGYEQLSIAKEILKVANRLDIIQKRLSTYDPGKASIGRIQELNIALDKSVEQLDKVETDILKVKVAQLGLTEAQFTDEEGRFEGERVQEILNRYSNLLTVTKERVDLLDLIARQEKAIEKIAGTNLKEEAEAREKISKARRILKALDKEEVENKNRLLQLLGKEQGFLAKILGSQVKIKYFSEEQLKSFVKQLEELEKEKFVLESGIEVSKGELDELIDTLNAADVTVPIKVKVTELELLKSQDLLSDYLDTVKEKSKNTQEAIDNLAKPFLNLRSQVTPTLTKETEASLIEFNNRLEKELAKINENENLNERQKLEKKNELYRQYAKVRLGLQSNLEKVSREQTEEAYTEAEQALQKFQKKEEDNLNKRRNSALAKLKDSRDKERQLLLQKEDQPTAEELEIFDYETTRQRKDILDNFKELEDDLTDYISKKRKQLQDQLTKDRDRDNKADEAALKATEDSKFQIQQEIYRARVDLATKTAQSIMDSNLSLEEKERALDVKKQQELELFSEFHLREQNKLNKQKYDSEEAYENAKDLLAFEADKKRREIETKYYDYKKTLRDEDLKSEESLQKELATLQQTNAKKRLTELISIQKAALQKIAKNSKDLGQAQIDVQKHVLEQEKLLTDRYNADAAKVVRDSADTTALDRAIRREKLLALYMDYLKAVKDARKEGKEILTDIKQDILEAGLKLEQDKIAFRISRINNLLGESGKSLNLLNIATGNKQLLERLALLKQLEELQLKQIENNTKLTDQEKELERAKVLDTSLNVRQKELERARREQETALQPIAKIGTDFLDSAFASIWSLPRKANQELEKLAEETAIKIKEIQQSQVLSEKQKARQIEVIERASAKKRRKIETDLNEERKKSFQSVVTNFLSGIAEMLKAELQLQIVQYIRKQFFPSGNVTGGNDLKALVSKIFGGSTPTSENNEKMLDPLKEATKDINSTSNNNSKAAFLANLIPAGLGFLTSGKSGDGSSQDLTGLNATNINIIAKNVNLAGNLNTGMSSNIPALQQTNFTPDIPNIPLPMTGMETKTMTSAFVAPGLDNLANTNKYIDKFSVSSNKFNDLLEPNILGSNNNSQFDINNVISSIDSSRSSLGFGQSGIGSNGLLGLLSGGNIGGLLGASPGLTMALWLLAGSGISDLFTKGNGLSTAFDWIGNQIGAKGESVGSFINKNTRSVQDLGKTFWSLSNFSFDDHYNDALARKAGMAASQNYLRNEAKNLGHRSAGDLVDNFKDGFDSGMSNQAQSVAQNPMTVIAPIDIKIEIPYGDTMIKAHERRKVELQLQNRL